MSVRNLDKLFGPRSVALIGATPRPGAVGAVVARNLRRAAFGGELMLVNPHHRTIDGLTVYPNVASLPQAPDLAVVVTPPETIPPLIGELGERGTRAAVVISAGFGELGERGQSLQRAALDAAKPHLLRIVGPNCLGIMVPQLGLDATFSHLAAPVGHIAFVSQSGAMITAMLDWAVPRGIGFSHVVSLGDMADVDFGDMLDYLAADPHTHAILLYAEAITHGRKFMSAARAASRIKPVLVLKAGRSNAGARAATSHTGALAGADAVCDAVFRRAGMLRVGTMAELFDAAETLALTQEQVGDRLTILTNGGGAGVLATEALIAAGGQLGELSEDTVRKLNRLLPATWSHGNPVDIIGDASGERYSDALTTLIRDREIDAVLVLNCPTALAQPEDAARAVIDVIAAAEPTTLLGRNVITSWLGEHSARAARQLFAHAHIATYETPDGAVTAFLHRVHHRRNQELLMETPPARLDTFEPDVAAAQRVLTTALAAGKSWLDPEEAGAILAAYGVPIIASFAAGDPDQVASLAAKVGFPVALKIRSPDITHKSDVGGVALNLGHADRVRQEAVAMLERVRAARPTARLDGFLLQPMISRHGAIELLVGLSEDPVFGPLVAFGQGGTAVEVVHDTSLELPPLNGLLARRLMARTRVWQLLQGYRGKPPANIDAIVEILIRLGQLAANHPEIRELDINPLLADSAGVVALDARLRVAPVQGIGAAARLAVAPYPRDLESIERLRDGTALRSRPLRPEDEPMLHDLAAHMSHEDLRLRFFTPMQGLTHAVAARLSQLDYDRELASSIGCRAMSAAFRCESAMPHLSRPRSMSMGNCWIRSLLAIVSVLRPSVRADRRSRNHRSILWHFLPPEDARVVGTIEAIERDLVVDGLVMRYSTGAASDGLPEGEGAFLACSFWLANSLALIGRHQEAIELFERLLMLRNDVGLLAEEYDPKAKRFLGNFPQAFSHIGIINTAVHLSRIETAAADRGGVATSKAVDRSAY